MSIIRWLDIGTHGIDILGEKWVLKVERSPENIKPVAQLGECDYHSKYICVWLTGELQRDLDTLFHELQHAIRMILGIEDTEDDKEEDRKDHKEIHPIALGLAYVFSHNRETNE